ncbi:unnamed protein product [Triticum turgidum subsp. durum]|uniref:F-box domain-containing protein n=1 Tax=Triticum turgidum subsp. durum TaxID=4567 RepID=A0A9R1PEZ7_TRITD|nr:unnamed protein product [Triticum turgidum subsp. durum]
MPGTGGATVLNDLPEWVVVEEILIRLPPKDILRCRVVCRWWHSATSTDKFMLDHRRRQPLLPILSQVVDPQPPKVHLLFSFDAGASQQQLCPVIQIQTYYHDTLHASLDGLLVVSHGSVVSQYFICNPVIRKCAPLAKPQAQQGFYPRIVGFYRHEPSGGEYRVPWVSSNAQDEKTFYYAIAVGSNSTRYIGQGCTPQPTSSSPSLELALQRGLPCSSILPPAHHRSSLHWILQKHQSWDADYIMVFNAASETFRLMCRPARLPNCLHETLLEMDDDTLALCSISSVKHTIDVWVVHDYDAETWSFKHRMNLTGMDPSVLVDPNPKDTIVPRMAVLGGGEMLIQFTWLCVLRFDIDGKFLGYVKSEDGQEIYLWVTWHYLQQSIIPLPLFHEMREDDSANQEPPFFIGL